MAVCMQDLLCRASGKTAAGCAEGSYIGTRCGPPGIATLLRLLLAAERSRERVTNSHLPGILLELCNIRANLVGLWS